MAQGGRGVKNASDGFSSTRFIEIIIMENIPAHLQLSLFWKGLLLCVVKAVARIPS